MSSGVKFLFDNYVSQDILANSDVSSEQAAFPIENAYNSNRRSKVWRSNGYFNVKSTNNEIVFRDTNGGPELTASIAVAEYNSTATFMAAVKAALEAVSADTFTVSQSTEKRFVIETSGSYLDLLFADAGSTAADILGFDDVDLSGDTSYEADEVKINTSEWILWDMGIASVPNAFAMTGPRNSPIKLSPSSVVTLKGNHTNPTDWSSPAFSQVIEFDDEVMSYIVEDQFYEQGLRFWRLEFEDNDNPLGYIEVGAFFLGRWFDKGAPQYPLNSQLIDRTETVTSEGGQTFSDILPKSQSFTLSYRKLYKEDIEEFEFWFNKIGTGKPFFVSLDTNEVFSTAFQRKMKYVKFESAPRWSLVLPPDKFTADIVIREEL